MSANRLEMHNISLAFSGFQALNKVDFTLHGGSVHGRAVRHPRPL